MAFSLEDFDEALEHESLHGRLVSVQFSEVGDVVELEFDLHYGWVETDQDTRNVAARVGLRFRGVEDWALKAGPIEGVRIVDRHAALVPLTDPLSRLSYRGEPEDSDATLAALHLAHAREFGRSVATFLQPGSSFPAGWTTGTVAEGPTSLMQTYARVLEQHGLKASLLPTPSARSTRPQTPLLACTVGHGYVIATDLQTYGDLPPTSLTQP